jgi:hypothetical protein
MLGVVFVEAHYSGLDYLPDQKMLVTTFFDILLTPH